MTKILPIPPKKELAQAYSEVNSSTKLAKRYGCSTSTIIKWLHLHEIPVTKPGGYMTASVKIKHTVPPSQKRNTRKTVCSVLRDHAKELENDPERLSTEFLQKLIGIKC